MRSHFDQQLKVLNREMVEMGALCKESLNMAAEALRHGDRSLARQVKPFASQIDRKEREIESLCLRLLLQQQPVARDLRQISAALKMITDMERIGDQTEDIAEIIEYLDGYGTDEFVLIQEMAQAVMKMVTESVDAYVQKDALLAQQVLKSDDIVDDCFVQVKKILIEVIKNHADHSERALDLLMIAKYFERIGDHATNIAEWVVFSVTGEHKYANE